MACQPSHNRVHSWAFAPFVLGLFFLAIISQAQQQQIYQPIVTSFPSSVYIDGKALYVQGGSASSSQSLAQAFSIDLSVSWNITNPPYKQLPGGPITVTAPSTLMSNNQSMFIIANGTAELFNLQSFKWSKSVVIPNINPNPALAAATDPATGLVYVPNGLMPTNTTFAMLRLNVTSGKTESLPMYPSLTQLVMSAVTWSASQSSLFLYGGAVNGTLSYHVDLYSYSPAAGASALNGGWAIVPTTGQAPTARVGSCMKAIDGGATLVLFGGVGPDQKPLTDIYFLDTTTKVWVRGVDGSAANARGAMACGVSNDQLVIWGGAIVANASSTPVAVYNMKTATWVSSYAAPIIPTPVTTTVASILPQPAATTTAADTPPAPSSPKLMIILGIVMGFLVLAAIIGALLYRARARRHKVRDPSYIPSEVKTVIISDDGFSPLPRNPAYPPSAAMKKGYSWTPGPEDDRRGPAVIIESSSPSQRPSQNARLHEGNEGARPVSQHPHAVASEGRRTSGSGRHYGLIQDNEHRRVRDSARSFYSQDGIKVPIEPGHTASIMSEAYHRARSLLTSSHAEVQNPTRTEDILGAYYLPRPVSLHPNSGDRARGGEGGRNRGGQIMQIEEPVIPTPTPRSQRRPRYDQ